MQQKESEWHHLKGQIRQYERERIELREKLDKIIGQFASLESCRLNAGVSMKKALDVEILGQKFTISSDAEEGYMLKVAGYVDGKMQELMRAPKSVAKIQRRDVSGAKYRRRISSVERHARGDFDRFGPIVQKTFDDTDEEG